VGLPSVSPIVEISCAMCVYEVAPTCREARADSNSRIRKLNCSIRAWRSSVFDKTSL
jgi:hypothetical protein